MQDPDQTQRLDKWLWCARFLKSRSLAHKLLGAGRLRLSGKLVTKGHQLVRPGDVLTFPQGPYIRVVRVTSLAERRGPAPVARTLYEDLEPVENQHRNRRETAPFSASPGQRQAGEGRPTKEQRRAIDRLMGRS